MIEQLAQDLIEKATTKNIMVATAESCTGGLIAGALTEIAGSSAVVDRGFVTYSNEAKAEMLGVSMADIEAHGAVSDTVARAMVAGALNRSNANIAVSVTGIAGPGGGSDEKPVGLVFIAVQQSGQPAKVRECRFADDGAQTRKDVRHHTVITALQMLMSEIE